MKQNINVRVECHEDISAIEKITIEAFDGHPHSEQTEYKIVAALREDDALSISLVAEVNSEIVGHIAFSKIEINNEFIGWYGLAPVSVKPEFQNQGVGSQLILSGLTKLKNMNANGCVLLGEPNYYGRFGFKAFNGLVYEGVPPEYFQALLFNGEMPVGKVEYHKAFS